MQKIPTLFVRGTDHLVTPEVNPDCQWVIDGQGVASEKFDGTCCLIKDGKLYRRLKDDSSFGWKAVGDGPEDQYHREACANGPFTDGTYELVGPKIQGNPDRFPCHTLIPHGAVARSDAPRDYTGLRQWLPRQSIEGLVWKHPDGRMAKIKTRDFGLTRPGVKE